MQVRRELDYDPFHPVTDVLAYTHPLQMQNNALELDQSWLSNNYVSAQALTTTLGNYQPLLNQSQHAGTNILVTGGKISTTHKLTLTELNNNTTGDLERAATGEFLYDSNFVAMRSKVSQGYEPKLAQANFSNDFSYDATNRVLSLANTYVTPSSLTSTLSGYQPKLTQACWEDLHNTQN